MHVGMCMEVAHLEFVGSPASRLAIVAGLGDGGLVVIGGDVAVIEALDCALALIPFDAERLGIVPLGACAICRELLSKLFSWICLQTSHYFSLIGTQEHAYTETAAPMAPCVRQLGPKPAKPLIQCAFCYKHTWLPAAQAAQIQRW